MGDSHALRYCMQAEVRNLLALLRAHGHVPNGARRYYLNRRRVQVYCVASANWTWACLRSDDDIQ